MRVTLLREAEKTGNLTIQANTFVRRLVINGGRVTGIELTNDLKKIDEVRREVGMVFQNFNLFPHLTTLENCMLAPI